MTDLEYVRDRDPRGGMIIAALLIASGWGCFVGLAIGAMLWR